MDRFIGLLSEVSAFKNAALKSNMDRFIERRERLQSNISCTLKSNMDRFIAIGTTAVIREVDL